MMKNVIICTFHCNYYAGKVKDQIGVACGTNGLNEKCVHNSSQKNYVPLTMYKTHIFLDDEMVICSNNNNNNNNNNVS
jgi:hypothetical protein